MLRSQRPQPKAADPNSDTPKQGPDLRQRGPRRTPWQPRAKKKTPQAPPEPKEDPPRGIHIPAYSYTSQNLCLALCAAGPFSTSTRPRQHRCAPQAPRPSDVCLEEIPPRSAQPFGPPSPPLSSEDDGAQALDPAEPGRSPPSKLPPAGAGKVCEIFLKFPARSAGSGAQRRSPPTRA